MKERTLFLLRYYSVQVIIFAAYKLLFLFANAGDEPYSLTDIPAVVFHGLPLDFAVAGYFTVLPLLLVIATIFTTVPTKKILSWYNAFIATAIVLALVADMSLYP